MSDKSTASSAGSSSSSSSSSSPSLASDHIPSSSKEPSFYALQQHDEHVDSSGPIRPLESTNLPPPELSLREPPAPDLLPIVRPTLAQFRVSEGAAARSAKLRALWEALPNLPSLDTDAGPTLYEEELVRICAQDRPDARLWGGPDEVGEELKTVKC
ncbi:hypothetical protein BCR39DRAFT_560780 [Naematelia encephala]|uniref:Uncharacterized protein n=1 Tax=Naematelia encephala TaxID=71784 RepID=A0A1Y2AU07_9TREE|nr:hypothetical protein BCR39DRAFT_560780 [Naematelia encephala]